MKVIVKEIFRDKVTNEMRFVGDEFDVSDKNRVKDLVERNLVEVTEEKPKKKAVEKN